MEGSLPGDYKNGGFKNNLNLPGLAWPYICQTHSGLNKTSAGGSLNSLIWFLGG